MSEQLEFSIVPENDGTWRFHLDGAGRRLATGSGAASRDLAEQQVDSVCAHARHEESFVRAESPDGRYFFNVLGDQRHVLATSERFTDADERDAVVRELMRLAREAPVGAGR